MTIKTLEDLGDLGGKTAVLRADFNVPLKNGIIGDDTRIRATVPTIKTLLEKGARVVILSHLGRPDGKPAPEYSLKPLVSRLSDLLGEDVGFTADCMDPPAGQKVVLMENLRFYAEEEENDRAFAERLAAHGDIFVNDAFSTAHRAHASTHALAELMPAYAGHLMAEEIAALNAALEEPERPVAAVVGGAKVSTKLDVLNHLIHKTDVLVLGGGMANTFLAAKGFAVGKSLHEPDMLDTARKIMTAAHAAGCNIVLPEDVVVAAEFAENAPSETVTVDAIPADKMALDIGEKSITHIISVLEDCKTVLWNGPMGAFEIPPFDKGTVKVAQYVAERTEDGTLTSIAGGGDTVAALAAAEVKDKFSYVSTAGGAFLEWIEGKILPAIAALDKAA
ncbi:MAG: phosphoglycerate kinase [Pseudomonadota bacterium]|nr:phosphoglycerate kinase [Pseudomonadota bacterium]QKK06251.1 MAG: phosphoglycerate kinase [Pseudomonadota bacterium]